MHCMHFANSACTDKRKSAAYQEKEDAVVVCGLILIVHDEGGIYVSQVVVVIQLSKGEVRKLCLTMETLEQMVT